MNEELKALQDALDIVFTLRASFAAKGPDIVWQKLNRVANYLLNRVNELGQELYSEVLS